RCMHLVRVHGPTTVRFLVVVELGRVLFVLMAAWVAGYVPTSALALIGEATHGLWEGRVATLAHASGWVRSHAATRSTKATGTRGRPTRGTATPARRGEARLAQSGVAVRTLAGQHIDATGAQDGQRAVLLSDRLRVLDGLERLLERANRLLEVGRQLV